MPCLAALIAERKRTDGTDWVNECWRRGLVQGVPGWFYGREGALHVGVPWDDALQCGPQACPTWTRWC